MTEKSKQNDQGLIDLSNNSVIAIIGVPRSGTSAASTYFSRAGLQVGHHRLKKSGVSSWDLVGQNHACVHSHWGTWQKIIKRHPEIQVYHQVRHPLHVISSLFATGSRSWKFMAKYISISDIEKITKSQVLTVKAAMEMWYYWNVLAEEMAIKTYQIENFHNIFTLNGEPLRHGDGKNRGKGIRKTINSRKKTPKYRVVTCDDLIRADPELYQKIVLLAHKYGYEVVNDKKT